MSTTYMVKSSLVFLACHINVVLMTMLYLLNMSKSTERHSILSMVQTMTYVLGVIFNVYVVLFASRKWELIVKYFNTSREYLSKIREEIKIQLINAAKASVDQMVTVAILTLEACSKMCSRDSEVILSEPQDEIKPSTDKEECIATQVVFKEKTPELTPKYFSRTICRPKSDSIRKTVRNELMKAQSPELLKNRIFKSRMNLTCDS